MSWTRTNFRESPRIIKPDCDSDTPELRELLEFHHAVVSGDLERLKRAITPGLDLETLFGDGYDGYTALHISVLHLDVFGFLLALGADPFALSWPCHEQPFHTAAACGMVETVRLLLDMGADVNSAFARYPLMSPMPATTALWAALHHSGKRVAGDESQDWIRTIDILVGCGAEFPPSMELYDLWSESYYEPSDFIPHIPLKEDSLFLKALGSRSKILWRSYLEKRRGLSPLSERTSSVAGDRISPDLQRILEDFGYRDEKCSTLKATGWSLDDRLSQEWRQERIEMARVLVNCCDRREPWNEGLKGALSQFSAGGNLELMEVVLERGADPETVRRALLAACASQRTPPPTTRAVIELLVKHGATFDGRVKDVPNQRLPPRDRRSAPGNTCLHQWADRRDLETLQYLLNGGADINATNDLGETVIMRFARKMRNVTKKEYHAAQDNYASFQTLIEAGSKIDARDNLGQTLLHHFASAFDTMAMTASAREGGRQEPVLASTMESAVQCLKLLATLDANPGVEDKAGKKPVEHFRRARNSKKRLGEDLMGFFGFDAHDQEGDGSKET